MVHVKKFSASRVKQVEFYNPGADPKGESLWESNIPPGGFSDLALQWNIPLSSFNHPPGQWKAWSAPAISGSYHIDQGKWPHSLPGTPSYPLKLSLSPVGIRYVLRLESPSSATRVLITHTRGNIPGNPRRLDRVPRKQVLGLAAYSIISDAGETWLQTPANDRTG